MPQSLLILALIISSFYVRSGCILPAKSFDSKKKDSNPQPFALKRLNYTSTAFKYLFLLDMKLS